MGKGLLANEPFKQFFTVVGYALVFIAEHPFSHAHFALRSGIRLIVLLLFPYRYWAALAIGEALPNTYEAISCLDDFGVAWVAIRCIPMITVAMPIVWFCRSKLSLFPNKRLVDFKALLLCVFACTVAWSGYSYTLLNFVHMKTGTFNPKPAMLFGYLTGNYFGILAVLPCALIARLQLVETGWQNMLRRTITSRVTIDTITFLIPAIGLISLLGILSNSEIKQIGLISVFLPAAWLTFKHGWHATAVGSAVAILYVAAVLPDHSYGVEVTIPEAFLVITFITLLALGARITAQVQQSNRDAGDVASVRKVAHQTFQQSEQRMRNAAQMLEYIGGSLHVSYSRLLDHIRRLMPHIESEEYYQQTLRAQRQVHGLADRLHPLAWRVSGLPAALKETVGRALDEAGIAYGCAIEGRGFTRANTMMLFAIYRLACEAVVYVCSQSTCNRIQLTLRGGETNGARWMVIRVGGSTDLADAASVAHCLMERSLLASKLGASSLGVSEMRDHARLFHGEVHVRASGEHMQVTLLLQDVPSEAQRLEMASAPLRLWIR